MAKRIIQSEHWELRLDGFTVGRMWTKNDRPTIDPLKAHRVSARKVAENGNVDSRLVVVKPNDKFSFHQRKEING